MVAAGSEEARIWGLAQQREGEGRRARASLIITTIIIIITGQQQRSASVPVS
jgi:hypothetical protein